MFNRVGEMHEVTARRVDRRAALLPALSDRPRHVVRIDAFRLQHQGELAGFFYGERLGREIVAVVPIDDREIGTDQRAGTAYDFERKACPILERSAPLIGALIAVRRQKRTGQVAVRTMDLDRLETGVLGAPHGFGKFVEHFLDFVRRDLPDSIVIAVERCVDLVRNGGRRQTGLRIRTLTAGVRELQARTRAVEGNGLGEQAQAHQIAIAARAQHAPFRRREPFVDVGKLDDEHAGAAFRAHRVVIDQCLRDLPVRRRQTRAHRRHHDPVLEVQLADLDGLEQR